MAQRGGGPGGGSREGAASYQLAGLDGVRRVRSGGGRAGPGARRVRSG